MCRTSPLPADEVLDKQIEKEYTQKCLNIMNKFNEQEWQVEFDKLDEEMYFKFDYINWQFCRLERKGNTSSRMKNLLNKAIHQHKIDQREIENFLLAGN